MFKNRSFRLKLVKDDAIPDYIYPPFDYNKLVSLIAKKTAQVVVVYVGADTVRRVVVYAASSRI